MPGQLLGNPNCGWIRGIWREDGHVRKVLVVFPMFHAGAEEYRATMDQVVAAARERGFETHNLLDDFAGRYLDLALSRFDAHPNAEAHAVTAAKLAELIGSPRMSYEPPLTTH